MIPAAGALVLLGLGLFVAGIVTGTTVFYWLCVAACVVAGLLLVLARLQLGRAAGPPGAAGSRPAEGTTPPAGTSAPPPATTSAGAPPVPAELSGHGATAASLAEPEPPAAAPAHPAAAPRHADAGPPPVAGTPAGGLAGSGTPATSAAHAHRGAGATGETSAGDPPVEEVEVTDLLLVVDLHDEVLVVDEHPRYHLADCPWLTGRTAVPLPIDEARTDGFTPCARCTPDRNLAQRERTRRGT